VSAATRPRWVVVAALTAVGALAGFAAVTAAIYGHGPLLSVDVAVETRFASHRQHWLVSAFTVWTTTASFLVAAPALLVLCAVVARVERCWRPLVLGAVAVGVLAVSVTTGKQVVGRSRVPFAANTFGDGGTSYPSGHTTTAVVVAGVVLLLVDRRLTATSRRWALLAVAVYSATTGASRIYLRQHWFSDVLAGWLLGTAIVCVLAVAWSSPIFARPGPAADGPPPP